MDLTLEDLRSVLKKRDLDTKGEKSELKERLDKALKDEKDAKPDAEEKAETQNGSDEVKSTAEDKEPENEEEPMDGVEEEEVAVENEVSKVDKKSPEKKPDKKETEKKPDKKEAEKQPDKKEAEKQPDKKEVEKKPDDKKEAEKKPDSSAVSSTADADEKQTEEEMEVSEQPEEKQSSEPETTTDADTTDAASAENKDSKDESKSTDSKTPSEDVPGDLSATKTEENESLIVLVDDIQNDLDADLAASEGKGDKDKQTGGKKADGSSAEGGNKGQKEVKTEKKIDKKKDAKDLKTKSPVADSKSKAVKDDCQTCNLWITGLCANTKATDLKKLFIKFGKVVGAKVVTTARSPSSRCYGFVTMSSIDEASKCIRHLNQTKLNGKVISVKRAKNVPGMQLVQKKVTKVADKKPVKAAPKKDGKPQTVAEKTDKVVKKVVEEKKPAAKGKITSPAKSKTLTKTTTRTARETKTAKDAKIQKAKQESALRARRDLVGSRHRHFRADARLREIDEARLMAMKLEDRQKKDSYRLERARQELRLEREKLERARMELASVEQREMWSKRERSHSSNRYEEEKRPLLKRPYDRNHMQHSDAFWHEHHKRNSMGDAGSGSSSSRFDHVFSESRFSDMKDVYERRGDPYYSRESKNLDSVSQFDVLSLGRLGQSSSRLIHDRYNAPLESNARLDDRIQQDKFDRMPPDFRRDSDPIGYHNHDSDRRSMVQDRGVDIEQRNVSAHNRLGRVRSSPVGSSDWKLESWTHMHGSLDNSGASRQNDRWLGNNISQGHDRGSSSSRGFVGRNGGSGGPSGSGMMQNMGPGNIFVSPQVQQSGMMVGGGGSGGGNLGGQLRESRFESYTNMDRGNMRRY